MAKVLPLVIVTVLFLSYFVYLFSSVELEDVRANWNTRRCEPLVMLIAQQVPKDPKVDTSAFASENFDFCMGGLIDSILGKAFAPVKQLFTKQLNVAEQTQGAVNTMRSSATGLFKPIMDMVQGFYNKMKYGMYQVIRIFFKIMSAIDRIFGIATASIFAGISMYQGMQNYINLIIKIVMIILVILVALVFFLFFIMAPFIPTILATIAVLVATAAGAAAGSMAGAFCVAPDTLVKLETEWKKVGELQPGDVLYGGATVEGVLEVMRKDAPCVSIDGLIISESHLVKYNDTWIFAGEHPNAKRVENEKALPKKLFCLNTSNHCWTVWTNAGEVVLRDWEELPEEDEEPLWSWEALIYELLNRQAIVSPSSWSAPGRGLLGPETLVHCCGRGIIPIREVKVGDWVMDKHQPFTQVTGIYKDISEKVPLAGPNAATWCYLEGKNVWRHPLTLSPADAREGYQLVTDSGTFKTVDELWVRDFTEVGHDRIHETYEYTASRLAASLQK